MMNTRFRIAQLGLLATLGVVGTTSLASAEPGARAAPAVPAAAAAPAAPVASREPDLNYVYLMDDNRTSMSGDTRDIERARKAIATGAAKPAR